MPDHPAAPEQRTVDVDVQALDTRGRTLHGYAAVYGATSSDLGGYVERIAPGAFAGVLDADVRCLLNHDPSQVLGRTRSGTLRLHDEARGLRFEADLPDSPLGENVRAAVARGDIDGASFRFTVGEEEWEGETRTVRTVSELMDVTVATYGAYPAASVELRTRPDNSEQEENEVRTEDRNSGGGLAVEDRSAADQPNVEARVVEAVRSIRKGEARSLTNTTAEEISREELSTFLWDRLRPVSVLLNAGLTVVATDSQKIVWPRLVSDVDPTWLGELDPIPAGDPAFSTLEAIPRKLAHRVELSNEVVDDSTPSVIEVLNGHLAAMLALRLDLSMFTGNPAANADSIRGLKFTAGVQTIDMGTNGEALTNFDAFVTAAAMLRTANVPPPYAIFMHPRDLQAVDLLKDEVGSERQLARPADLPPIAATSQLPVNETKGTATNASSAYVLAPAQLVLVQRQDAVIELDRSRLFDIDASEMRAKLRADLIVPHPQAVVRVEGIVPAE